jgi:hypothetical protein
VLKSALGDLSKRIVREQCRILGTDLVQISPNPSTIGDWCDEYAGKVFSISGATTSVLPVSILPNRELPPFHVRCHHFAIPFSGDGYSDEDLASMSQLPEDYLELGRRGAGPDEYTKLWREKHREELRGFTPQKV